MVRLGPCAAHLAASPSPRRERQCRRGLLARIIYEGFYCTSRYAAATGLTAGGLAAQPVNILCFKYASFPRGSARRVSAVSSRTLVNNVGLQPEIERLFV
jgi:hypothetical protein